jgi:hypothetical protein
MAVAGREPASMLRRHAMGGEEETSHGLASGLFE